jgi:hypothetical protein
VLWAGGTTAVVYYLGLAAEHWLARFSWVALVVAVVVGVAGTLLLRERTRNLIAELRGRARLGLTAPAAPLNDRAAGLVGSVRDAVGYSRAVRHGPRRGGRPPHRAPT